MRFCGVSLFWQGFALFSRRLFFAPRGYKKNCTGSCARSSPRQCRVWNFPKETAAMYADGMANFSIRCATRRSSQCIIFDGFQGRYNGFAERKVPRSAPERTLQSPWRNMNLSCIFSRKSPLNFLSPRLALGLRDLNLLPISPNGLRYLVSSRRALRFRNFFTFPIYEYYGRFKGFRSGHFKIRLPHCP